MKNIFRNFGVASLVTGFLLFTNVVFVSDTFGDDRAGRHIKIEKAGYEGIEILQPSIRFSPEYDRYGNINPRDNIYINGSIRASRAKIFLNVDIIAEFYDAEENLITRGKANMLPRTFSKYGRKVGKYSLAMENDPRIALCKLSLTWSGKK